MSTKICTNKECGLEKPLDCFYKQKSGSADGLQRWCKDCSKKSVKKYVADHPETTKTNNKRYFDSPKGVARSLLAHSRQRASGKDVRERVMDHDIDIDFVLPRVMAGYCELTGWPFRFGGGDRDFFKPSLDRIDSSQGYTKSNTRVVCWGVNDILGHHGQDKLLEVADAIRRNTYEG